MAKTYRRRSLTKKMRKRRLYRHQSPSMRLKRALTKYFNSGWLPGAICFGLLSGAIAALLPVIKWSLPGFLHFLGTAIASLFLIFLPLAFGGFVGSTIWNLVKRRWWRGGLSCTLMLLFLGTVTASALRLLVFVNAEAL
ncbi:MAG: hypothetical protein AAFQ63_19835 [Cyanobacteria bacterium J06621_11]